MGDRPGSDSHVRSGWDVTAGSTNKNTHPINLCELSPTPLSDVYVICEKFKLGLSEILFVST
jgi:hypothetical protein